MATLNINIPMDITNNLSSPLVTFTGEQVDSVNVPAISGSGTVVLYYISQRDEDFYFDSFGYNATSGALGYYTNYGITGTLRVSGTYVILSGFLSMGAYYGQMTGTLDITAQIVVLGGSNTECSADSGVTAPNMITLGDSGKRVREIRYKLAQSVVGKTGKFSILPNTSTLVRVN